MQLSTERLNEQLKKGLNPFYLIYGEEPFTRFDALNQIKTLAQQQDFEIKKFEIDAKFDLNILSQSASELSLFSSKSLYHLQFKHKITKAMGDALLKWLTSLAPRSTKEIDNVIIVELDKLEKSEKSNPCIVFLEKQADVMACWPLTKVALQPWLRQRAKSKGLQLGEEVVERLSDCIEGNLLAADQILTQLSMVTCEAQHWDEVKGWILDSARFDVYALSEACLLGQPQKALFVFKRLREEGTQMTLVLWTLSTLAKNLNRLFEMSSQSYETMMLQMGVWKRQQPLYRQMMARHDAKQVLAWLQTCAKLDDLIKHSQDALADMECERLVLAMAGVKWDL